MTGDSGGDTVTQSDNSPWGPKQVPLKQLYKRADSLYKTGDLAGLGDQSANTVAAQQGIAGAASGGGFGVNQGAIGLANQTLGGDFLSQNNPYLQDAISYSQQPVIDAWNEQIMPGIDASFGGSAGGLGSGAYASARNRGEDTLARNLSGAATQAGYQNYGDERARMMQTMGMAPGIEDSGYANFDRLGQIGGQQDARSQAEAERAGQNLSEYARLIQGGGNYGSSLSKTSSSGGGFDPYATGAGAAAIMASLFAGS